MLKGIPATIPAQDNQQYNQFEIKLASFYDAQEDGSWRIKTPLMPVSVMTLLKSKGAYSNAREVVLPTATVSHMQTLLAQRLNTPKAPVFSYLARNDTTNYYFYRKMHEHMPGTMLIEMARQAFYHYVYSETGHLRGNVAISMTDLNAKFINYVESAYAVEILTYQSDMMLRTLPRIADKTISFYQNGHKAAQIRIKGPVIKNPLFKRLRTLHIPRSHWFTLSPCVSHHVLLRNEHDECLQAVLNQISTSGIRLDANSIADVECTSAMLYLQGTGFITFSLTGEKTQIGGGVELPFGELTASAAYQLQHIIKCYGVFCEKRPFNTVACAAQTNNTMA